MLEVKLERVLELIGTRHGAAQELADAIDLPKNSVTGWRSGRLKSYKKYAPQIAEYYGVSLDWLSGRTDDRTGIKKDAPSEDETLDDTVRQITAKMRTMNKQELDRLLAMIKLLEK